MMRVLFAKYAHFDYGDTIISEKGADRGRVWHYAKLQT